MENGKVRVFEYDEILHEEADGMHVNLVAADEL